MKTEQEIRDMIESLHQAIDNYRQEHREGNITVSGLRYHVNSNQFMISALLWVLGENDRYD